MPRINKISNINKLVEQKVNYFLDSIDHTLGYAGWQWQLELESPISLLEKVILRLNEEALYRLNYFDNYFKHQFFSDNTIWDNYPQHSEIVQRIRHYNQLDKAKEKINLISDPNFKNELFSLYTTAKNEMSKHLLKAVTVNILCPHGLDELIPGTDQTHGSFFESVALILVSQYIFAGYSKGEIREIVSRVFSKNISAFPFPNRIKTVDDKKKHLAERSLEYQLNGFVNVFDEKEKIGIIVTKVYGARFPDDFEFTYNKVSFYGKSHPKILRIKEKINDSDIDSFFVKGTYILAFANIKWYSEKSIVEKISLVVRKELTFLSALLDRDLSVDTTHNYIKLSSKGEYQGLAWSSRKFDNDIDKSIIENLNDNSYQILRKIKGASAEWFLKYEPLFVMAYKNNSLSDYWLYLETLLSYNRQEKKVMEFVSTIILSNEKEIRDRRIMESLLAICNPIWEGTNLFNVSIDKWKRIVKNLRNGKIAKEIRQFDYPFVQYLVRESDANLDREYYKKAKDYYYSLLTEAYEYRNYFIHRGAETQPLKDKLLFTLPNIVVRLRWLICDELKKGDINKSFDLFVDNLFKKGEMLIK